MKKLTLTSLIALMAMVFAIAFAGPAAEAAPLSFPAFDPGVYTTATLAGGPIPGLTPNQLTFFTVGRADFAAVETVADGLGPRYNLSSCGGCHAQPAIGGSSPFMNPQIPQAQANGEMGSLSFTAIIGGLPAPAFTATGPIREVRFKRNPDGTRDGGVHNTATITGLAGTIGCSLALADFAGNAAAGNVSFRIPTPVFGA